MVDVRWVETDIVMIGGGAAAALAAISARAAGASVALVTKETSAVGGATIMAAGGTATAISPADTPDLFLADILKSGCNLNDRKLARMLAEHSVEGLLGLEKLGFLLDRSDAGNVQTRQREGHAFPRSYMDRREALGICHGIARAVAQSGTAIFPETVAAKLLMKDGRVVGVLALDLVEGTYIAFHAKAVMLATGGLGALYEVTTNANVLTGDGFALAWQCGAQLVDMEMVQFLPLAFAYPKSRRGKMIGMCSHFGKGVKLLNGRGERYMGNYDAKRMEFTTRDIGARANYTEIMEGRGTKNGAIVVDPREHDEATYMKWKTALPHHYALHKTVFGDRAAEWKEPFEAMPSAHFFMGGLRIDEHFQTTVPGLFAVGEIVGGIHGANRLAGVAFAEVFAFGPLAGESVARFVRNEKRIPPDHRGGEREAAALDAGMSRRGKGVRPFELKERIQSVMWKNLGPVRNGKAMRETVAALKDIDEAARRDMILASSGRRYNRERIEAIEVPFMVQTALLVAQAALTREESRGSHYRSDFPAIDDERWLKNIVLTPDSSGQATITLTPVNEAKP